MKIQLYSPLDLPTLAAMAGGKLILCGADDSFANAYAKENGIPFAVTRA